ncbi:MAG: class I SAM-dependent RNA methyltransferase [Terriglobales bacterium]
MILSIEKLIYGGDGLARTPPGPDGRSMAVFVPFVLPGESVEADIRQEKPGFARGTVTRLVETSPERIAPGCPYFEKCGGCNYQHIRYEQQLEIKVQILRETFERVGKITLPDEIRLHPSPPWNYRNRTRLQVRTAFSVHPEDGQSGGSKKPEFALGYFRFGSHQFLPVRECPISSPLINRAIARLTELGGLNCPAAVEELELFADAEDEHLLGWAFCRSDVGGKDPAGKNIGEKDLLSWAEAVRAELPTLTGLTFFPSRRRTEDDAPSNSKPLAHSGAVAIRYRTPQHDYQVSAGAFFQVNRHLVDELSALITSGVSGEVGLDLYAGVGLFSVPLSHRIHHIFAVEASQTSFGDLRQNVPASVKAVGALAEDYLRSRSVRIRPDLVVLDPPRTGAGKAVVRSLIELGAQHICYVSCDPATLARDLAPLLGAGYRIEKAHLFDMFPQTFHIESVILLAR